VEEATANPPSEFLGTILEEGLWEASYSRSHSRKDPTCVIVLPSPILNSARAEKRTAESPWTELGQTSDGCAAVACAANVRLSLGDVQVRTLNMTAGLEDLAES